MISPQPWRREKTGIYHAEGGHPIFVSVDLLPLSDQHDNLDAAVAAVNERDALRSLLQTAYWRATADERDKGAFEQNKKRYARELSELLGDTWLLQAGALLEGTQDDQRT